MKSRVALIVFEVALGELALSAGLALSHPGDISIRDYCTSNAVALYLHPERVHAVPAGGGIGADFPRLCNAAAVSRVHHAAVLAADSLALLTSVGLLRLAQARGRRSAALLGGCVAK